MIPTTIECLENLQAPVVDRPFIEEAFRLSPRRALTVMHRLGAVKVGAGKGIWVLGRQQAIRILRAILDDPESIVRLHTSARLAELLGSARRDLQARKVTLHPGVPGDALPPTITISRTSFPEEPPEHSLQVIFTTAQNLLEQLYAFGQLAARDYETFEAMCGGQLVEREAAARREGEDG